MKLVAAVLAILSVACGPAWNYEGYQGDPTENAIAAYTQVYGAPTEECAQRARDLEIDYMPLGDVRLACRDQNVVGCANKHGDDGEPAHAYIAEGETPDVVAHETLHVLMFCGNKLADNQNHSGRVWRLPGIVRP